MTKTFDAEIPCRIMETRGLEYAYKFASKCTTIDHQQCAVFLCRFPGVPGGPVSLRQRPVHSAAVAVRRLRRLRRQLGRAQLHADRLSGQQVPLSQGRQRRRSQVRGALETVRRQQRLRRRRRRKSRMQ